MSLPDDVKKTHGQEILDIINQLSYYKLSGGSSIEEMKPFFHRKNKGCYSYRSAYEEVNLGNLTEWWKQMIDNNPGKGSPAFYYGYAFFEDCEIDYKTTVSAHVINAATWLEFINGTIKKLKNNIISLGDRQKDADRQVYLSSGIEDFKRDLDNYLKNLNSHKKAYLDKLLEVAKGFDKLTTDGENGGSLNQQLQLDAKMSDDRKEEFNKLTDKNPLYDHLLLACIEDPLIKDDKNQTSIIAGSVCTIPDQADDKKIKEMTSLINEIQDEDSKKYLKDDLFVYALASLPSALSVYVLHEHLFDGINLGINKSKNLEIIKQLMTNLSIDSDFFKNRGFNDRDASLLLNYIMNSTLDYSMKVVSSSKFKHGYKSPKSFNEKHFALVNQFKYKLDALCNDTFYLYHYTANACNYKRNSSLFQGWGHYSQMQEAMATYTKFNNSGLELEYYGEFEPYIKDGSSKELIESPYYLRAAKIAYKSIADLPSEFFLESLSANSYLDPESFDPKKQSPTSYRKYQNLASVSTIDMGRGTSLTSKEKAQFLWLESTLAELAKGYFFFNKTEINEIYKYYLTSRDIQNGDFRKAVERKQADGLKDIINATNDPGYFNNIYNEKTTNAKYSQYKGSVSQFLSEQQGVCNEIFASLKSNDEPTQDSMHDFDGFTNTSDIQREEDTNVGGHYFKTKYGGELFFSLMDRINQSKYENVFERLINSPIAIMLSSSKFTRHMNLESGVKGFSDLCFNKKDYLFYSDYNSKKFSEDEVLNNINGMRDIIKNEINSIKSDLSDISHVQYFDPQTDMTNYDAFTDSEPAHREPIVHKNSQSQRSVKIYKYIKLYGPAVHKFLTNISELKLPKLSKIYHLEKNDDFLQFMGRMCKYHLKNVNDQKWKKFISKISTIAKVSLIIVGSLLPAGTPLIVGMYASFANVALNTVSFAMAHLDYVDGLKNAEENRLKQALVMGSGEINSRADFEKLMDEIDAQGGTLDPSTVLYMLEQSVLVGDSYFTFVKGLKTLSAYKKYLNVVKHPKYQAMLEASKDIQKVTKENWRDVKKMLDKLIKENPQAKEFINPKYITNYKEARYALMKIKHGGDLLEESTRLTNQTIKAYEKDLKKILENLGKATTKNAKEQFKRQAANLYEKIIKEQKEILKSKSDDYTNALAVVLEESSSALEIAAQAQDELKILKEFENLLENVPQFKNSFKFVAKESARVVGSQAKGTAEFFFKEMLINPIKEGKDLAKNFAKNFKSAISSVNDSGTAKNFVAYMKQTAKEIKGLNSRDAEQIIKFTKAITKSEPYKNFKKYITEEAPKHNLTTYGAVVIVQTYIHKTITGEFITSNLSDAFGLKLAEVIDKEFLISP